MSPTVSIIVPTRNRSDLLFRCLDAIARQQYEDYEVIVVDDGSTSDCRQQIDSRIATLGARFKFDTSVPVDSPSTGPSATRNRGIRQAKGRYLAMCDDDDFWSSDRYLADAVPAMDMHELDILISDMQGLRGDDIDIPTWFPDRQWLDSGKKLSDQPDIFRVSLDNLLRTMLARCPHLNACVMRMTRVRAAGEFWEVSRYWEDGDFFARIVDASSRFGFRKSVEVTMDVSDRQRAFEDRSYIDRFCQRLASVQHVATVCSNPKVRIWANRLEAWYLREEASRSSSERRWLDARYFYSRSFRLWPQLQSFAGLVQATVMGWIVASPVSRSSECSKDSRAG